MAFTTSCASLLPSKGICYTFAAYRSQGRTGGN